VSSIAVQLEAGRTDAALNQAVETTCAPLQAPYERTRPLSLQAFAIPSVWHAMVSTASSQVQTRDRVRLGTFSGVSTA